jgi:hypothetical protein
MTIPRFWRALLASAALFAFIICQLASCHHEVAQAKVHLKLVMIFCEPPIAGLAVAEEVFEDMEGMPNCRFFPFLNARISSISVHLSLLPMQKFIGLGGVGNVARSRDHSVNNPAVTVRSDVRFHPEIPLLYPKKRLP